MLLYAHLKLESCLALGFLIEKNRAERDQPEFFHWFRMLYLRNYYTLFILIPLLFSKFNTNNPAIIIPHKFG